MKIRKLPLLLALVALLAAWAPAQAADLAALVDGAVEQAAQKLGPLDQPDQVACLTNAGYARWQGASTRPVLDLLAARTAISPGRGNLLVRPDRAAEPLYVMFIKKDGQKLLMTHGVANDGGLVMGPALDIHVGVGTSFEPFNKALGPAAFNLVSLANGWALGLPEDIMRAALIHGHLCCGVFTGYFTARFIEKHIPLGPGERYVYIGAPAWCQDDYICDYLRLTPGVGAYLTMAFPWSKAWPAADKTYDQLGGVIVRFDPKSHKGRAYVLRFDWRQDAFRRFIGQPDLKLDWHSQPWLHKAYDRFFLGKLADPEFFVSIYKEKALNSQADYDALTALGANPLAVLLGPAKQATP